MWLFVLLTVAIGYLLGNLNGAVCISKVLGDDVRTHGSGNAGLTNFIRNYGTGKALAVILIDAGKAVAACLIGGLLMQRFTGFQTGSGVGGLAVILGHAFPVFLGFRGGKGILSGFFVAIVVDWRIALLILAVFAAAYLLTGYVSLGSVLAAVCFTVSFILLHRDNMMLMVCGALTGALATYMHRENILRLVRGQERKTNLFKK